MRPRWVEIKKILKGGLPDDIKFFFALSFRSFLDLRSLNEGGNEGWAANSFPLNLFPLRFFVPANNKREGES